MSNWKDLPAGKELDKVVAERLGWQRVRESGSDLIGLIAPDGQKTYKILPSYSTDLNAAWDLWRARPSWRGSWDMFDLSLSPTLMAEKMTRIWLKLDDRSGRAERISYRTDL